MAKVILEFDGIEEEQDARTALDGWKWKMAIGDLDQELRSTTKHDVSILNGGQPTELEYELVEKVREKISSILTGYGLNLD